MASLSDSDLFGIGAGIKFPTLCNRFRFGEWVGISKAANNTLALQLTSFEMNFIQDDDKFSGLRKTARLVFEDSVDGTTFNAIQELRDSPQVTIEIMSGGENPLNFLNMYTVSVKAIKYKLGYAINGIAEFIVDVEFIRTNRTVD